MIIESNSHASVLLNVSKTMRKSDKMLFNPRILSPLLNSFNKFNNDFFNNVVCATSKGSDQPVHMRSLIRTFASRLNILSVKLLIE